jgi:hypothetical protein
MLKDFHRQLVLIFDHQDAAVLSLSATGPVYVETLIAHLDNKSKPIFVPQAVKLRLPDDLVLLAIVAELLFFLARSVVVDY